LAIANALAVAYLALPSGKDFLVSFTWLRFNTVQKVGVAVSELVKGERKC